ncbi:MAG: CPBP family intramembrane metalloprotease [Lachnospiraceae bacterium]|nr:CPBP family intramembrane metalloprotease [Lachnospiraceae bacterium]
MSITASEDKRLNSKRIVIYLVITFVLTYAAEILVIAPLWGSADMTEALIAQNLTATVMMIPAFAVVLTRLITKEGFFVNGLYLACSIKKNWKYFLFIWFGSALLVILGAALYFVIFPSKFDPNMSYISATIWAQAQMEVSKEELQATMILQFVTGILLSPFINAVNCFGEEWGWRGYLLPKMQKQFSIVPTLLISGVIWGLWHAPLTVLGHNYGVGYPGFPITGILMMCLFCTVLGIIFSYVTIKTKSCIPAVMGHGLINGFASIGICFTSVENPFNVFLGPAPTGLIGLSGFTAVAVYLLIKLHKEEKTEAKQEENA